MNIVVTGGLGHIGSKLIRTLEREPEVTNILVFDSFLTQRFTSLFDLGKNSKVRFFECDVKNISKKELEIFGQITAVIHLAAMTDASGTLDKRNELFENNLGSTKHIVELCKETGTPLIFPSSTSVYGSQSELVDETNGELKPQSPYAECKLQEEKLVLDAFEGGLRGAVLRLGTIHGVSSGMRFHTAVNKFCFQASLGLPLTVWKTALHQRRPYLSLDDAISCFLFLIKKNELDGNLFNVVTANYSVSDIIDAINRCMERECVLDFVESKIMNQLSYEVSNRKIIGLGFKFTGSLNRDVQETMDLLSGLRND
jgi:nucleoside-diphosphate-sugar epimerase